MKKRTALLCFYMYYLAVHDLVSKCEFSLTFEKVHKFMISTAVNPSVLEVCVCYRSVRNER
jgi:hypothetical protein